MVQLKMLLLHLRLLLRIVHIIHLRAYDLSLMMGFTRDWTFGVWHLVLTVLVDRRCTSYPLSLAVELQAASRVVLLLLFLVSIVLRVGVYFAQLYGCSL